MVTNRWKVKQKCSMVFAVILMFLYCGVDGGRLVACPENACVDPSLYRQCIDYSGDLYTRVSIQCYKYKVFKGTHLVNGKLASCPSDRFNPDEYFTNDSNPLCLQKTICDGDGMYICHNGTATTDNMCCCGKHWYNPAGLKIFTIDDDFAKCEQRNCSAGTELKDGHSGRCLPCANGMVKVQPGFHGCITQKRCPYGILREGNGTVMNRCKGNFTDYRTIIIKETTLPQEDTTPHISTYFFGVIGAVAAVTVFISFIKKKWKWIKKKCKKIRKKKEGGADDAYAGAEYDDSNI